MRSFFALAIAALSLIGLGVVSLEEAPPAGVAAELPVTSAVVSHDVRPAGDAPAPHAPPARAERDASEILRQARADAEAPLIEPIDPSIPVPWQLADGPHVAVPVGNEHVPATAAELDPQVLARAEVGEPLALMLPDVGAVEVVVQRVADVAPGTTVIQGQLADFEEDLPVVLTQSGNYTFVNVSTQNGVYTGEFADGSGWLHFDDLEDRLVDHSNPDVLVPGDEETS